MSTPISRIVLVSIALLVSEGVSAGESLRCGNQLISTGDTRDVVRHKCGNPSDISYSIFKKKTGVVLEKRVGYKEEESVEVQIELWTYNFGANRFMRRLQFVAGTLTDIETLGYGYE